jgi:hypothetical protein
LGGVPFLVKDNATIAGIRLTRARAHCAAMCPSRRHLFSPMQSAPVSYWLALPTCRRWASSTASRMSFTGQRATLGISFTVPADRAVDRRPASRRACCRSPMAPMAEARSASRLLIAGCSAVSRGRLLPGTFAVPEWPRLVDGCLSRTVRDTALYLGMTQDPNTPLPTLGFVAGKSSRRLTIAVMYERMLGQMPDPEVRNAVADTAELCRQLGHVVEEAKPPLDQRELGEAAQRLGAVESQKRLTPSSRKRGCQGSRTVSNRARSGCASGRCGVDLSTSRLPELSQHFRREQPLLIASLSAGTYS